MNKTLESSRAFPFVAWTLVIGFALFTYSLTVNYGDEVQQINSAVASTSAL